MVLAEISEPEKDTLVIGYLEVKLEGVSLADVDDDFLQLLTLEIGSYINNQLRSPEGYITAFELAGYNVHLDNLFVLFESAADGSIIARFKIVGGALITTYGLIASYPSFKDALPIISEDISKAVVYFIEHAPERSPEQPKPVNYQLFFKDEDELLEEIEGG